MGKVKDFFVGLITSAALFFTGCGVNKDLEEQAKNKLFTELNGDSNNVLILNEETGVIRGMEITKDSKGVVHVIAENKEQTKPYFVNFAFDSNKLENCNGYKNVLNSIANAENVGYDITAQETTYEILSLVQELSGGKSNAIVKYDSGKTLDLEKFNKGQINSIYYYLNEQGTYNVGINSSIETVEITMLPILVDDMTVMNPVYNYRNYVKEDVVTTNISNKEQMNDYIVDMLEAVSVGEFDEEMTTTLTENKVNFYNNEMDFSSNNSDIVME